MAHSEPTGPGGSATLLAAILETLEACGLDRNDYRLYDFVDVEALEQVLASPRGNAEVRFTVQGIRLAVTADSVDVLIEDDSSSAD